MLRGVLGQYLGGLLRDIEAKKRYHLAVLCMGEVGPVEVLGPS